MNRVTTMLGPLLRRLGQARLAMTLAFLATQALPSSPALARPLTAREAVRAALDRSPELVGQRLSVASSRTIARGASAVGLLPPVVGVEAGVRRNASGQSAPEVSLSLSQPVRWTDVAQQRGAHASAIGTVAESGRAEAELSLGLQVLEAWLGLKHWERVVETRSEAVRQAEQLAQTVSLRVQVGAAQPGDDALAESMLGRAAAERMAALSEVRAGNAELQLLLDAAAGDDFETRGELDLPNLQPTREHPAAAAVLARADERRKLSALELSEGTPPLGVGLSVTREGTSDWLLLAHLSVPLPTSNSASYAAAQTRREVATLEFEARHLDERLARLSRQAQQRSRTQQEIVDHIRDHELEPARRALQVLQLQFRAAKAPLQNVVVAHDRVIAAELHLFDEVHEMELTRARLAWLQGWLVSWARRNP